MKVAIENWFNDFSRAEPPWYLSGLQTPHHGI